MVSSPNIQPPLTNPVRSVLEEINELIATARAELKAAELTIKRCTFEIEKWSAVANQLAIANRIAEQAIEERTRLLKPAVDTDLEQGKRGRVPKGFWRDTMPVITKGGVDREHLIARMKDKARQVAPDITDDAIHSALWAAQNESQVILEVDGVFYPASDADPGQKEAPDASV